MSVEEDRAALALENWKREEELRLARRAERERRQQEAITEADASQSGEKLDG